MSRRIGIILAALVAVLAVVVSMLLPPIIGAVARSLLDDIDRDVPIGQGFGPAADVYVAFDDWDAGWFSSTAYVSLDSSGREGEAGALSTPVPVPVTLRHGPVLAGTPSGLGWASIELVLDGSVHPLFGRMLQEWGVDDAAAHLGVLVGLGGSIKIGAELPPVQNTPQYRTPRDRDRQFDFRGLEATATLDLGGDSFDLVGEFGGLRIVEDRNRLDIGRINFAAGASKVSAFPGLWLSDAWIGGTGFTIREGDGGIEAEDFGLRVNTGIRGDAFDAALQGDVSQLLFDRVRLSDLAVEFSLQCAADALANLMRLAVRMQDSHTSDLGFAIDSGVAMATTVDSFLRERLTVGIDRLSFMHEDRSASATLAVEFRGDELPGYFDIKGLEEILANPAELPASADLDVAFHRDLPRGLASTVGPDAREVVDSVLLNLVRMGVFEAHDDDYTMQVRYGNGTLDINGEQLDLSYLFERVREVGFEALGMLESLLGGLGIKF